MERLNSKYNLDCFFFWDSELDSESDKGEQYQYKQGYEDTYLKSIKMLKMSRNFCNTSFLKYNLLIDSLRNKWTKIFNLITAQILITIYEHNCIHVICSVNFVQQEHTTFQNYHVILTGYSRKIL